MLAALHDPTYRKLFSAQVIALLGTGLATVALGLLAYDIAGARAASVLGTALTIKICAYVVVSPVMAAATERLPRKAVLVGADAVRAAIALSLPFVTEVWQVYLLVFVLQSASATFTPAFQALIPAVLPDEDTYTGALSLSRLAYDLEAVVSPLLAGVALLVMSFSDLFFGTCAGFVASAGLVLASRLPPRVPTASGPSFAARTFAGLALFARSGELRSLAAMNMAEACAFALTLVTTVVFAKDVFNTGDRGLTWALAAFGLGSMMVAVALPRVLRRVPDRPVMLAGVSALPLLVAAAAALPHRHLSWGGLVAIWIALGAATSLVATPSARLLRRASNEHNRQAVFTAQFSASHACYLLTYPLAGYVALQSLTWVLAGVAAASAAVAWWCWPGPRSARAGAAAEQEVARS